MSAQPETLLEAPQPLPSYRALLLAVDSSDHANHGTHEAAAIAGLWDATVTGTHVYAAMMHDARFRQMEGGLPEQYRQDTQRRNKPKDADRPQKQEFSVLVADMAPKRIGCERSGRLRSQQNAHLLYPQSGRRRRDDIERQRHQCRATQPLRI